MTVCLVRKETVMVISGILVAINVIVFILLSFGGMTEDAYYMYEKGAMYVPAVIYDQEYYRIFTSMFMHFGFEHLLNNMVSLIVIGKYVEPLVGKIKFLFIYLLSGIGGNILSFVLECYTKDYAVSAGASGAVFGLTGALLCLVILNHGRIGTITRQGMIVMVALSLYNGFASPGVDNAAHVGGLIVGFLATGLFCWKFYRKQRTNIYFGSDFDEPMM